jgi:hypothetical protein
MTSLLKTGLTAALAAFAVTAAVAGAAPAQADPDSDFANELHSYGIYGAKDYNAWIGKIQCKRLATGLDPNATAAAAFLRKNLDRDSTEQQIYQFLSAGINYYCPDKRYVVDSLAGRPQAPSDAGAPMAAEG